jgi:hypothetical protein
MQEQRGQSNEPPFQELRQRIHIVIGICHVQSQLVQVFLRVPGTWGERFAGIHMLASWVVTFFWAGLFPGENHWPMLWFFVAATAMLLVHRVSGVWRRAHGREVHSRYPGDSWLGDYTREAVFLCIAAAVALAFNKPLGVYLAVSAFCFVVSLAWQREADQARIRNLRDMRIEQEALMRRVENDS